MLNVLAGDKQIAEYKRLLTSEWDKSFPDEVLALLWSCIRANGETKPLLSLLNPSVNGVFPTEYFRSLVQRIGEAARFISAIQLPKPPLDYAPPKRLAKAVWQADRLATYMTLQAHIKLAGAVEFFKDVQSVAFHAALHYILPAVRDKHPDEHSVLLHSALLFTLEYSASDPAHFCYLTSALHSYLGNTEQRLHFLYAAFRFTAPEDHSFLTKAEEFWAELLDAKRYEEAEKFLFALHWWCLPNQQEEVRAMVLDAFKIMLTDRSAAS